MAVLRPDPAPLPRAVATVRQHGSPKPSGAQRLDQQKPDRPRPEHCCRAASLQLAHPDRMQRHRRGLVTSAPCSGQAIGHLVDPAFADGGEFGKAAAAARQTVKAKAVADIVFPVQAGITCHRPGLARPPPVSGRDTQTPRVPTATTTLAPEEFMPHGDRCHIATDRVRRVDRNEDRTGNIFMQIAAADPGPFGGS